MLRSVLLLRRGVWAVMTRPNTTFTFPSDPVESLNFVNGRRVQPSQPTHQFKVYEPATGKVLCECGASGAVDVSASVKSAQDAFPVWSDLSGFSRGQVLKTAASIIRENLDEIALWEVRDNGKPVREARIDISGCADTFDYFGGVATTITGDHIPLGAQTFAYTRREPLGVCAGIGAWNYPFQTASWKLAPALAAGNTFVYKPSPFAPVTAVILAEILLAAGVPAGAVNIIQGEAETGRLLCLEEAVRKVSFTGSVPTGQKIMQTSASRGIKPVTLELGGKSPLIVFPDADINNAVIGALMANFYTQGQVCSNASRVFVHTSLIKEFTEKLLEETKKLKIGDPHEEDVKIGATITKEHMNKVLDLIDSGREEGAKVLCGGERVRVEDGRCLDGYFLSPCVLEAVTDEMRVSKEEIFGAVLLLLPFDTEEEVIRRANDTPYGLAAGLFTKNLHLAHRAAAQLQAGSVWVNTYNPTPVELPFGGFKLSGFGRELGLAALHNYTQVKSVLIEMNTLDPF